MLGRNKIPPFLLVKKHKKHDENDGKSLITSSLFNDFLPHQRTLTFGQFALGDSWFNPRHQLSPA